MSALNHLYNFAQRYVDRCTEIQKQANVRPNPPQPGSSKENPSVIILDDEDEVEEIGRRSISSSEESAPTPNTNEKDFSRTSSTSLPHSSRTEDNVQNAGDLHITGVSVMREWIDISELDVSLDYMETYLEERRKKTDNRRNERFEEIQNEERRADSNQNVKEVADSSNLREEENEGPREGIDKNWADLNVEEEEETDEDREVPEAEKIKLREEARRKEKEENRKEEIEIEELDEGKDDRKEEIEIGETQIQEIAEEKGDEKEESEETKKKEEKFKCSQCSYRTNWKNNMTKHIISRHKFSEEINWFQCDHCHYRGKTKEYLRTHLRQNHEQFITWHSCPKCPFKFKAKQFLQAHVIAIHTAPEDIKWIQCEQCDFKCKFKTSLREHMRNRHTDESEIRWFRCESCHFKTKAKKSLKSHLKTKHEFVVDMLRCEKCGYECEEYRKLEIHTRLFHAEEGGAKRMKIADDVSESELLCKACGFRSHSKMDFQEHFRFEGMSCYWQMRNT